MLRLFPPFFGGPPAIGLLIIRLVAGLAMTLHGWTKITHPFSWMGPDAPVPGIFQALAAVAEFGGGLGWMLGLLTLPASALIAGDMAVALGIVHLAHGHPFVAHGPGSPSAETAALYLGIGLLLLLVGPGRLSLDWPLWGRRLEQAPRPAP